MLALAHALETHKTLSGEDVTAVFEGGHGPLVDGAPYADDAFIDKLREYHLAAERAHREHNQPQVSLPVAEPAYAIADGYGTGSFFDGSFNGNGSGTGGVTGTDDVIDFGGLGTGRTGNGHRPARRADLRPAIGRFRQRAALASALQASGPAGGQPAQRVDAGRTRRREGGRRPPGALARRAARRHGLPAAGAVGAGVHARERDYHAPRRP